jgi:drug/metabolite transporter (DMT)-like permease
VTPSADPAETATRREHHGALLCVLSAASFASVVILAKVAYAEGADPLALLTVRFAVAAAVLWLLAARAGALRFRSRRDPLLALALGGLVYSSQTGMVFAALERIDASLTELLVFSFPALVVLGAAALGRERFTRRRLVALAMAMAGVALVLAGATAGALDLLGTTFGLAAALLYAGYVLSVARVAGRMHALALAALVCSGSALALGAAGAAAGSFGQGMSAAAWALGVALALGSTVVAVAAFLGGVARLGPSRASILATLEPPIACGLAFLVFGERLTPLQLAGGALVVAAAVALQLRPVRSLGRGAPARPSARPAARALTRIAAGGRRLGVRAEMGRLSRDSVRGREPERPPVARR